MNEQEQWDKLGSKLLKVAKDAAKRASGKPAMMTVHVLVDEQGTPADWFGPYWERITPEQWQAAKDAVAAEIYDEKKQEAAANLGRAIDVIYTQERLLAAAEEGLKKGIELNSTGVVQIQGIVAKAIKEAGVGQEKLDYEILRAWTND